MAHRERTDQEIIGAVEKWVEMHFAPDEPCIDMEKRSFTPREILGAMRQKDPDIIFVFNFLRMVEQQGYDPLECIEQTIRNNASLHGP